MTMRPSTNLSRRALLTGGAAGAGALIGAGATAVALRGGAPAPAPLEHRFGQEHVSCHGEHQAGIVSAPAAQHRYAAYDLRPEVDRDGVRRLLRVLTADIEALTSGEAPLADSEPELAAVPAGLTVTVGFGGGLVDRVDPAQRPTWLAALPAFSRDALDGRHDGGDLLLVIAGDDSIAVSHASRMLHRSLASFATPRWVQQGFRRARGAEHPKTTMRNLMGQVDGTVNPAPDSPDFAGLVWHNTGWLSGGSALVVRRIRMELDTWEQVDRPGREQSIGRTLKNGAPLTGAREHDEPDFAATDSLGLTVIPDFAHIRRARSEDPAERIYRRAVNYDDGTEQGLLFACYQRDPLAQFVPIQRRLDELDLLNEWVTHTGSAVFAVPGGWRPGGMLGASLFA
ncbi:MULTISPECIES: Dyp-type peroxidase [unclassified Leucobacter]|uniref:Dyp-type peroxidase n=1 Tax=unclassified Leucobacter TaxID=2621730 RepID=UPI00165D9E23|nr:MULTISPECIES: Dyp-type peroxidase [unclassified Leucobacter]MBC9935593.1 Dyp-type peroxidase [Leucobacter sp. cx-87]